MASDKKPTAPLEKPEDAHDEFETSSHQVVGEDESLPAIENVHRNKAFTRKLLLKLDTRCVLSNSFGP